MKKFPPLTALLVIFVFAGFGPGCGKSAQPPPPNATTTSTLPGAADVMAALDKKDYDGAMAGLLKAQQGVANKDQEMQFSILQNDAKQRLLEAAATEPKAAEALATLRAMTLGR